MPVTVPMTMIKCAIKCAYILQNVAEQLVIFVVITTAQLIFLSNVTPVSVRTYSK